MGWRVETLNSAVDSELDALPADVRAKFVHIAELLETFGPFEVREPYVKSLGKKLFEKRSHPRCATAGKGGPVSTIDRLKRRWQTEPAFRKAYDDLKPEFAIARQLIAARNRAGASQAEVARKMGTTQSTVARLESGQRLPAMSSLQRYANAVGHRLDVRLVRALR